MVSASVYAVAFIVYRSHGYFHVPDQEKSRNNLCNCFAVFTENVQHEFDKSHKCFDEFNNGFDCFYSLCQFCHANKTRMRFELERSTGEVVHGLVYDALID